jgi:hypothetical protein
MRPRTGRRAVSQLPLDFNSASDTSRLAAVYNLPNRAGDRDRALRALIDAGERGLNDFELAAIVSQDGQGPIQPTSVGKRRLELERDGLVARRLVIDPATLTLIPDRRPAPSGAPSGVYTLARWSTPEQR